MMKRFFSLLSFILLTWGLQAQDTLTVMHYNLLEYGNYNSGFADCYETNNNTQHKDECIRTILDYVKPDILTVNEFGATQRLLDGFIQHNLNTGGINYWMSDNIINYNHSNIINHIFYDSRKMGLKRHVALYTSPRDTDVYEFYLKTPGIFYGDTTKLVCVVAHPKAGQGYESSRRATMQVAMDYIKQHYATDNVLIMGDFNMYGASESGYQLLTKTYSNPEILFVDPLSSQGGVGEWNNNSEFARFHTQSTRSYSNECFSNGGLDDRFDMILMADEIYMGFNKMKYINGSYYAVGNDGRHYNQSINQNSNNAVPEAVADALYDGSDHLPVTMKIRVFEHLDVEEYETRRFQVYPNPTNNMITVEMRDFASLPQEYRITNILGQVLMTGHIAVEKESIDLSTLPAGLYFIHLDGVTQKFLKK